MQTSTQTVTATADHAAPKVLTPKDVIDMVRSLGKQAYHRISFYPKSPTYADNLIIVNRVLVAMNDADASVGMVSKIKIILAQHRNLLLLAPSGPVKWRKTHIDKVEEIAAACREYLGWEAQK